MSIAFVSVVEEASHSMGQQLNVHGVRDESFPGFTDHFAAEQGAGGEEAEDPDNDIVREAGKRARPLVAGLLHFGSAY